VDDNERRAMRMGRVRFLIEAGVGFAISIAILTGLLYLATREMTEDPSWPDPLFVWLGIGGTVLGLAASTWLDRNDPGARDRSWRSRLAGRSWLAGGLLAFAIWSWLYTVRGTVGGEAHPWEMVLRGIGRAVRAAWAALSGRSTSEDLFPF
jgi:hypothetical protein